MYVCYLETGKKMPKEVTKTWKWVLLGRKTEVGRGGGPYVDRRMAPSFSAI